MQARNRTMAHRCSDSIYEQAAAVREYTCNDGQHTFTAANRETAIIEVIKTMSNYLNLKISAFGADAEQAKPYKVALITVRHILKQIDNLQEI